MDGMNLSPPAPPPASRPASLGWLANDRLVLLLGAPRSGTSWVAKVFDSQPSVLYRHEPDISLRANDFPFILERGEVPAHVDAARRYLAALLDVRSIKAVGSRPRFPKTYGSAWLMPLRDAAIAALRVAEAVPRMQRLVRSVAVPDLLGEQARRDIHVVLKSVSSGGRARLFAEAVPGCRVVFLLRHPGGQVTSMMRGAALGKFDAEGAGTDLLGCGVGQRYGFTPERYAALPLLDKLVWNWVLFNEKVMDDIADVPTACIARHQDLVADPLRGFGKLFGFARLSWTAQTEEFIRRSTTSNAGSGYYSILRNSADTLEGWRTGLPNADQERMRSILRDTAIGQRWPDLVA
jgi:hypothetical protein